MTRAICFRTGGSCLYLFADSYIVVIDEYYRELVIGVKTKVSSYLCIEPEYVRVELQRRLEVMLEKYLT